MTRRVLPAMLLLAAVVLGTAILVWAPREADAMLDRAQDALAAGRADEAARLARDALAARPLDGRAYRVLAQVASVRGDPAQWSTLTALAVQYAPRDVAARAMAAQIAIDAGDIAAATRHYDRMLRVDPESAARVFPVLVAIARTGAGREELLAQLASQPQPPWRAALLTTLAHSLPAAADLPPLFHPLSRKSGLSAAEMALYIGRFVDDRQWQAGYLAWLNELPQERLKSVTSPVDGDFELQGASGAPFDWQVSNTDGIEAGVVDRDDGGGHALRVVFTGVHNVFRHARQLLLLQPGQSYTLRWRSRLDALDTPRGLHWVLRCAEGSDEPLLNGELLRGSSPWQPHEQPFDVPRDCPAQWLQLELEARIPAESYARGQAWFDDVGILSVTSASR